MKPQKTYFASPTGLMGVEQRGLSIIELLISMAIGLVILAAGAAVYVSSGRASTVSDYSTRLNEDGVLAMNFLQTQIRQAGYYQKLHGNEAPFEGVAVRGCSGKFADPKAGTYKAVKCPATADVDKDAILVRYEADTSNTFPTSADEPTNCNGEAITAPLIPAVGGTGTPPVGGTPARFQADNRFYVENGMLQCAGSTGAAVPDAQPLFANIEQMVLRYGVAKAASQKQDSVFDANKHQIEAYLSASDIDKLGGTVDDNWGRVLSVKICLLVKSERPVKDAVGIEKYTDCHGAEKDNADHYLYRTFVSTVMLRNRLVTPEQAAP